ncbi:MAG: ABC transporter permease [Planctomycetota bacterium]
MNTFLAILGDSIRETIDRRSMLVLLLLSLAVIAFCGGVSFQPEPTDVLLTRNFTAIGSLKYQRSAGFASFSMNSHTSFEPDISEPREVTEADGLPEALSDGWLVELQTTERDLNQFTDSWNEFQTDVETEQLGSEESAPQPEFSRGEWEEAIRGRLSQDLYSQIHVEATEPDSEGGVRVTCAVATDDWSNIPGAHKMSLFYGLRKSEVIDKSKAEAVIEFQRGLANTFVGFIGLLIALGVAASFVPSMLQKGTLDLVLARPIGRVQLLLTKFVGGLSFIFIFGAFLIGGCWLALGIRTGYWDPMFLCSVFVLVLGFSFLYSVAVTVGVWSRSTNLAFMISLGIWGVSSNVAQFYHFRDAMLEDAPSWVKTAIEVLYTVLPKVGDLDYLNIWLFTKAKLDPAASVRILNDLPDIDWTFSIGTSLAFTAVVLAAGCWLFKSRDY